MSPHRGACRAIGRCHLLLALFVALVPRPAVAQERCGDPARPRIAEVLYDPSGADSGNEFVELFHPGTQPWPLAGARLEAGDGSTPGRWKLAWTGAARDTLRAGARFVIGGAHVAPLPDAVVALELQNGPDAVRLVWPDGVSEVVGYGALEFAEFSCGAPAPDVPSGSSLARVPDDARHGANALDFRAAAPSPGRANQAARDVAIIAGSLRLAPEQPAPGASASLELQLVARGLQPVAALAATVLATWDADTLARAPLDHPLAPGDSVRVALPIVFGRAAAGVLRAAVRLDGDENPENDADTLRVRAGPGPLEVTEIQFHPARDEGEWIEVLNRTGEWLELASFRFGDATEARAMPAPVPARLAPGALAVIAQDRARLLAAFAGIDSARVFGAAPWQALNNHDGDAGVADVVSVRAADGTPCTTVPYRAAGIPNGVPLERDAAGDWVSGAEPAGSPLAPPRVLPRMPRALQIAPRRMHAGARFRLDWALPWEGTVEVAVYDLAGRRVAVALAPTATRGRGARADLVAPSDPGVYVVALRARSVSGAVLQDAQPLRVEGRAP